MIDGRTNVGMRTMRDVMNQDALRWFAFRRWMQRAKRSIAIEKIKAQPFYVAVLRVSAGMTNLCNNTKDQGENEMPKKSTTETTKKSQIVELLTIHELAAVLKTSTATIYRRLNEAAPSYDPSFPRPVVMGLAAPRWIVDEVNAWVMGLPRGVGDSPASAKARKAWNAKRASAKTA